MKIEKKTTIVFATATLLALLLSMSACSPEIVTSPEADVPAAPTENISYDRPITPGGANPEFVEDYLYMWELLENEYPSLSAAERITGKDAQEIKERYLNRIPSVINAEDFLQFIVEPCLGEFQGTGHLSAISHGFYVTLFNVLSQNPGEYGPALHNFAALNNPISKNFYGYSEPEDIPIIETPEISGEEYISENLRFVHFPEQSAAVVKLFAMKGVNNADDPEIQVLWAFLEKLEADGYENCIIDIRGNGGGNDIYWKLGLTSPNLKEPTTSLLYGLIKGESCAEYVDLPRFTEVLPIEEFPVSEMPRLDPDDLAEANHFVKFEITYENFLGEPIYTGKFWLLIDEWVYSASESMAVFCKETGFAAIVGTNSGGDGVGMNPLIASLPNTGICFRFSSLNGLNPDGSCNEEFGTTPDFPISPGEDALEKCLELIGEA